MRDAKARSCCSFRPSWAGTMPGREEGSARCNLDQVLQQGVRGQAWGIEQSKGWQWAGPGYKAQRAFSCCQALEGLRLLGGACPAQAEPCCGCSS